MMELKKEWFEPGPDGKSPFTKLYRKSMDSGLLVSESIAAAFRALLELEQPAPVELSALVAADVIDKHAYEIHRLQSELHARADIPALVAEVRRLRELCAECIESIEDWAGYASDYYREKHGCEGEINDYKARLNGAESEGT